MPCEPIKDVELIDDLFEVLGTKRNGFVYQMYLDISLSTGLRVSDVLRLRKKDVQNGIVKVKQKKNSMYRHIALNDTCRKQLEVYTSRMNDEDLIFTFKRQWIHKLLKWAADQLGMDAEKFSTHSLRKTAGWFHYLDTGKDLVSVQHFLGHRDPKETLAYLMINDEEVNEILVKRSWRSV